MHTGAEPSTSIAAEKWEFQSPRPDDWIDDSPRKEPSRQRRRLTQVARDFFLNTFDSYGESQGSDPRIKRKTCAGAWCSIVSKILFVGLVIFAIVRFATTELSLTAGDLVIFNLHNDAPSNVVDFPAMYMEQRNRILFYEKDASSLQKIDVLDRNGIYPSPRWSSSSEDETPQAKAIYAKTSVPFNSYVSALSQIPSKEPHVSFSLDEIRKMESAHDYLAQTIRALYEQNKKVSRDVELHDHTQTTFVRFTPGQLESLKKCQLQLSVVNAKEFGTVVDESPSRLYNTSYDDSETLPSLTSDNFSWNKNRFDKDTGEWKLETGVVNLLYLTTEYSLSNAREFVEKNGYDTSVLDVPSLFHNWMLMISYANNFMTIAEDFVCSVDAKFSQSKATAKTLLDTSTTIISGSLITATGNEQPNWMRDNKTTPFNIMIWGSVGFEIAQVTSVAPDYTLTLQRSNPVDFTVPAPQSTPVRSGQVPDGWICEPYRYGDGICDCNCGVLDNPDCFSTGFNSPSCSASEQCSLHAVCVPAFVQRNPNQITISDACEGDILERGGIYSTGYLGSQAQLDDGDCHLCPGDKLYEYEPQYDPDRRAYYCNYVARGYIDPNSVTQFDIATTGTPPQAYVRLPISLANKPAFPRVKTSDPVEDRFSVIFYPDTTSQTSLTVVSAENAENSTQTLSVFKSSDMSDITDVYSLLTTGELVALSTESTTGIFFAREVSSPGRPVITMAAPTGSSFTLTLSKGSPVTVSTATKTKYLSRINKQFQKLTLSSYPKDNVGVVGLKYAGTGDQIPPNQKTLTFTINSETTFDDYNAFFNAQVSDKYKMFIYDTENPDASEWIEIERVDKLFYWTGIPSRFNEKDKYCDCGFNQYDPDCGRPNAFNYVGNGNAIQAAFFIRGCNTSHPYCGLDGACSATQVPSSESGTPIPDTKLQLNITLVTPTSSSHPASSTEFYISGKSELNARRTITVKLSRDYGSNEYHPSDRYKAHYYEDFQSPSNLDVEVAMFLAPKLTGFDQINLCPNNSVTNTMSNNTDYNDWRIDDDFIMKTSCGSLEALTFNSCDRIENILDLTDSQLISTDTCFQDMPPTRTYTFNVTYPVNYKFSQSVIASTSSAVEPEYLFDFETIYKFSYDQSVEGVEKQFADGIKVGGDSYFVNGALSRRTYFGAPLYRGTGAGDGVSSDLPASVPYLSPEFTLRVNITRTLEVIKEEGADLWPSSAGGIEEMVKQGFDDLNISWDMSQVDGSINQVNNQYYVPMEPGYTYTLTASIQITPRYTENTPWSIMGSFLWWVDEYKMLSWRARVVTTTVSKQDSASVSPNDFRMRYIITFDSKNSQEVELRTYTIQSFISDIGAYAAILGVGIMAVGMWQSFLGMFGKHVDVVDFKEEQQIKKVKKKVKKDKKDTELQEVTKTQEIGKLSARSVTLRQRGERETMNEESSDEGL